VCEAPSTDDRALLLLAAPRSQPDAMRRRTIPVLSHQSAALEWELDLLRPPDRRHVTVPRNCSRLLVEDAVVHRADLLPSDVVVRDGELVTTALRTALDLSRVLPLPEAVAVVDSGLRTGLVRPGELRRSACGAWGPGSRALLRTLALADPKSGSFLESYLRARRAAAGLAPERTQHWVMGPGGRRVARVDFAWPSRRVVVEVDGYAFHSDRVRYRVDRRRQNSIELAGWLVLRFSWEDVLSRPDVVVASVRRALYGDVAA
jgi:very-short-patch-repair endonuclease